MNLISRFTLAFLLVAAVVFSRGWIHFLPGSKKGDSIRRKKIFEISI